MAWQDRFRVLGDKLTAGKITIGEYRERSEEILAEAEREADQEADREADQERPKRTHIPTSAALEAPSGEMTQIVGAGDETAPVSKQISEKLGSAPDES